jgi:hypothetical protein
MGLVAALAAAGVLVSSGGAQASAPSHQVRTVPFGGINVNGAPSFIPGPWHVGDCWLFQGTYLAFAGAGVLLHGESGTEHTNNADIWHSSFRFLNDSGVTLFSVGPTDALDSPPMVPINGSSGPSRTYSWDRSANLTPAQRLQAPNATQVVWDSSC